MSGGAIQLAWHNSIPRKNARKHALTRTHILMLLPLLPARVFVISPDDTHLHRCSLWKRPTARTRSGSTWCTPPPPQLTGLFQVCVWGLPARHTLEPRIYNLESATLETLAGPSQFDERDLSFSLSLSLSLSGCRYCYAMLCVCCRGVSGEPWMRLVGWRLARQMVASLAGTPAALLPLFCLLALEIFVGIRLAS